MNTKLRRGKYTHVHINILQRLQYLLFVICKYFESAIYSVSLSHKAYSSGLAVGGENSGCFFLFLDVFYLSRMIHGHNTKENFFNFVVTFKFHQIDQQMNSIKPIYLRFAHTHSYKSYKCVSKRCMLSYIASWLVWEEKPTILVDVHL